MADKTTAVTGGCLCGTVRYEASEPPFRGDYCHCRMCQKALGNVFAVFANFRKDKLRFVRGEPKIYKSSSFAERGFCAKCGTPLMFRYLDTDHISISVGSLDQPEKAAPSEHVGVESWVPWLVIDDGLARTRTEDDPDFIARKAAHEPD